VNISYFPTSVSSVSLWFVKKTSFMLQPNHSALSIFCRSG